MAYESKYKPFSNIFYELNEIFVKFNLFENINKKSKISCISNENSILEFLLYSYHNLENIFFIQISKCKNIKIQRKINLTYHIPNVIIHKSEDDILKYIENKNDLIYLNFVNNYEEVYAHINDNIADNGKFIIRFSNKDIDYTKEIYIKGIFIKFSNIFEKSYIYQTEINNNNTVLYFVFINKNKQNKQNTSIVLQKNLYTANKYQNFFKNNIGNRKIKSKSTFKSKIKSKSKTKRNGNGNGNGNVNNKDENDKYKIKQAILYCKKYNIPYIDTK
jgi:hypothetical protein